MTGPLESRSYPSEPTMPSAPPLGYVAPGTILPQTVEPPKTSAQIEAQRAQFYDLLFQQILVAIFGFYTPSNGTPFQQMQDWANSVGLGDLFEILTGVPDADQNDLGTWVNTLLGINRPVPEIQAASVVDTNPNLLLAPNVPVAGTVLGEQNWTWSNSAGHDSIGAIQVVAAGYITELLSNQIRAVVGQKLDLSVWVKWNSLTYTGTNPIVIGVTRYFNYEEVGSDDLAFFETPAGTQDWTQLAYSSYAVPAGCDEIRLRFKLGANLTAGTVYWDDAAVVKTQPGSGYVGSAIDNMIQGLENVNQPGWGVEDLFISMLNQFKTTTDHAARITLLENLQSPGNKVNDEFLRVGATLGSNWNQFYTGAGAGTWETNGDYAFWAQSGVSTREVRCRYIGATSTTLTDTQKIVAVLGSKGGVGYFTTIVGFFYVCEAHIDLYGRMNTSGTEGTDWIRARFSARGDVTITRSVAGVTTDLNTAIHYDLIFSPEGVKPAGAGSTLTLLCGTGSGARFFEAQINGTTVCSASDATSSLGAGFRGYGHGARAEGSILILGQTAPPMLNAWAALDN